MLSTTTKTNLRLYSGDHVLCLEDKENDKENSRVQFGQIFLTEETVDDEDEDKPKIKVFKRRVIWNGSSRKIDMDMSANYLVNDRRFKVGQRVKRCDIGGEIVGASEMTTLFIHGSNDLITSEVSVNNVKPLTNYFYGVNVELAGWIGTIKEVQRLFEAEFEDGTKCFLYYNEPGHSNAKSMSSIHNMGYRYIEGVQNLSAPGITTSFSEKCLKNLAVWDPDNCKMSITKAFTKYADATAKIVSNKTLRLNVDWLGRICGTEEPVPNGTLYKADIKKLTTFYIHPYRYFYKNGLCEYKFQEHDVIESLVEWDNSMQGILTGLKPSDDSPPSKKMKSAIQPGDKIVVYKHIIRHRYDVKWDNKNEIDSLYGYDLERDPSQFEDMFFPPYVFVERKGDPKYQNWTEEYGVVIRRKKSGLDVQWVKVKWGKLLWHGLVKEESSLDVIPHRSYNRFTIGKHVFKKKHDHKGDGDSASSSSSQNEFEYGTVLRVDRHKYGKIIVYCCTDQTEKAMWPFELELITYDPISKDKETSASESEYESDSDSSSNEN